MTVTELNDMTYIVTRFLGFSLLAGFIGKIKMFKTERNLNILQVWADGQFWSGLTNLDLQFFLFAMLPIAAIIIVSAGMLGVSKLFLRLAHKNNEKSTQSSALLEAMVQKEVEKASKRLGEKAVQ